MNRVSWQHVIFSHESGFRLRRSDDRRRVYIRQNERYAGECLHECDHFVSVGLIVLTGLKHCRLINRSFTGVRYRDEILSPIVSHGNRHTFQHHNARCHVAPVAWAE